MTMSKLLDYNLNDFDFHLPEEQIAQHPLPNRASSRLLCLNKSLNTINHEYFYQLASHLKPGDLLVLNDTRVMPARLYGVKASGGQIECMIERVLNQQEMLVQLRASKSPRIGSIVHLATGFELEVIARQEDLFHLRLVGEGDLHELIDQHGQIPLPPYIERQAENSDLERYQTVYAEKNGAVAAPTAGLHFDQELLKQLQQQGIEIIKITLHVGAGTFQPVRVDNLEQHKMHSEWTELSELSCSAIRACKQRGGRVVAVGTTVARCLETAAQTGQLKPYVGETRLFIRPGFTFHCIDALITNFHLPKSTLLMLVCAFGGYKFMMQAYQEAVQANYRFFSYGDAMLIQ